MKDVLLFLAEVMAILYIGICILSPIGSIILGILVSPWWLFSLFITLPLSIGVLCFVADPT